MRNVNGFGLSMVAALVGALVAVGSVSPAFATDRAPESFVWIITDTGYQSQDSALGMARGLSWPVIFGTNETIGLQSTSTLGPNGPTYWHQLGGGVGGNPNATSTPDGQVAGAGIAVGYIIGPTGSVTVLPNGTNAVDFNAGGSLVYSIGYGQPTQVVGFAYNNNGSSVRDIAVSPFGDGGVITADGDFYSTLTGDFQSVAEDSGLFYEGLGSLTFDAQGRPHVIDRNAQVFSFDTISGVWTGTILDDVPGNRAAAIAADTTGTVGAAFVNSSDELIYAYWTNSAGWQSMIVDFNVDANNQVGLAFDADDLPVISYSAGGDLKLAYDPIVAVPEPGSFALAGGLGLFILGRRRRG